ncbi:alpha/beta fold hydrolase [Rhodobacteraceae bacterium NNCM2]|nr:alpha/beta fold hydrolase [Coraliihabitans acroporae]
MSGLTFVLVHGACHGAWCWEAVAGILTARGHKVHAITQTGLGEKAHLLSPDITLETFITDLTDYMTAHDLDDAVLVGHSFAGSTLSGAAERMPERIRRLIYLDALIARAGETPFDQIAPDTVAARIKLAEESSSGLSIPVPPAESYGVTDPAQAAWLMARLTPHPLSTYQSPLPITGTPGAGLPCDYIMVTAPVYEPLAPSRGVARQLGWPIHELATGHDAMVTAPNALAELLLTICADPV